MPFQINKMLVGVDGSETSDYALNIGLKLGDVYSARLDLLHVGRGMIPVSPQIFDPLLGTTGIPMPTPKPTLEFASNKPAEGGLAPLVADRLKVVLAHGLQCSGIQIDSDDVSGEILKTSAVGKYDLIVLGSKGFRGIKGFLLGSVSQKIAKEAKRSVLIVKTRIDTIPKILLGYDGSEESRLALEVASSLAKKFRGQVRVVSVVSVPISAEGYMISDMDKWEREMRDHMDNAVSMLRAEGVNAEGKVVDFADVSRALIDEAERGSFDMIVVGNRGQGRLKSLFLGSVASGIANSAKTNVLIVR